MAQAWKPLGWNEIRSRALSFAKEWSEISSERSEAQTFWNSFFNVFGITRQRVASFEKPVRRPDGNTGFVDLLWKGKILVEHKSRGRDLDRAYLQALDYFPGLNELELPRVVLVSDFERFRFYDLIANERHDFHLKDLHKNVHLFSEMVGYRKVNFVDQDPVNIKAAELMGELHDSLKKAGFTGHELEVFLVRILFCLFAEDNQIFEPNQFLEFIQNRTQDDGSDLGPQLSQLFQTLDTPEDQRMSNLDETIAKFNYINGKLFEKNLRIPSFDKNLRNTLLKCAYFNWAYISPAVFGALFQCVLLPETRRILGAHYTSEKNILKVIKPLFLDKLLTEFESIKRSKPKLEAFHMKLQKLRFLDPACGCGNFLVIAYREIRLLEIEVIKALSSGQRILDVMSLIKVNVDQFYGIEIEEFPARIAETALWLMDHQMNQKASVEFGEYYARLPLKKAPNIVHGNALTLSWESIVGKNELSYILGNPPFAGHHLQSVIQKAEQNAVLHDIQASGVMDFVSNWFYKAAEYIQSTKIQVGFVATNSITQGEQVGILWSILLRKFGIKIHFAHRTFKWSNEARGKAAVYCVIIGFGCYDIPKKLLFEYEDIKGEPHVITVDNINPYLVPAKDILIINRGKPINSVPEMLYGNKPTDGGFYLLTDDEKKELVRIDQNAKKFIKPFISAKEYLNNEKRWCIWLVDAEPSEINSSPEIKKRVQQVKEFRTQSTAESTRSYKYHTLFRQVTQPTADYILIPRHSSENRKYIPFGFFDKTNIVADSCFSIGGATIFHFGVLESEMHMTWVRNICGRIKSDYRYSKDIVYNNFPWPENYSEAKGKKVESKAQKVLDVRKKYANSSLADLYDPNSMAPDLIKAHQELDRAVDDCYRPHPFHNEAQRMEFLFHLYEKYTQPLTVATPTKKRGKKSS